MNQNALEKFIDRIANTGMKVSMRYVSILQYKILGKMAEENKLDSSGFVKPAFLEEYRQRLQKHKDSPK